MPLSLTVSIIPCKYRPRQSLIASSVKKDLNLGASEYVRVLLPTSFDQTHTLLVELAFEFVLLRLAGLGPPDEPDDAKVSAQQVPCFQCMTARSSSFFISHGCASIDLHVGRPPHVSGCEQEFHGPRDPEDTLRRCRGDCRSRLCSHHIDLVHACATAVQDRCMVLCQWFRDCSRWSSRLRHRSCMLPFFTLSLPLPA